MAGAAIPGPAIATRARTAAVALRRARVAVAALALVAGAAAQGAAPNSADGEVPLPAFGDWRASLVHQSETGVWYVHVDKVVDAYGQNDILAAADDGHFLLLTVYSGKWTAHVVTPDGQWLAPSLSADVDPRIPGRELYAAGKGGSVHRIVLRPQPFGKFALDAVEVGHAAGEEFHAVRAGDLDPSSPGAELLVFGISGALFRLTAEGADPGFAMSKVAQLPGRVRDTVVLVGDGGPVVYGAARSGDLVEVVCRGGDVRARTVLHEDSGLGRIAHRAIGGTDVLYVTRDDGVLLRLARDAAGGFVREVIYVGPLGLRGVAAGRFHTDGREAVAVYGYCKDLHLVERTESGWHCATIFRDAQQGHFLAVGELDGRNGTDEIVCSGFGGRVVQLSRPPGYGLDAAVGAPAVAPPAAGGR